MIDALELWDRYVFEAINSGMAHPFLDWLTPLFRNAFIWAPVYVFFAAFVIRNFPPKGIYIVIFGLLTFMLSDQISAHIMKPLIARPRPCNDAVMIDHVRLLIPCGSGESFPSSHAANHFAFSVFIISILPLRMRWVLPFCLLWAAGVAFAQVYVGIHYPLDVIGGAVVGSIIGFAVAGTCRRILNLNLDRGEEEEEVIDQEEEPLE
jgi:membrane-associated phospholipid phosphatase